MWVLLNKSWQKIRITRSANCHVGFYSLLEHRMLQCLQCYYSWPTRLGTSPPCSCELRTRVGLLEPDRLSNDRSARTPRSLRRQMSLLLPPQSKAKEG